MSGKYSSSSFSVFLADGYNLLAAKVQGISRKVEATQQKSDGIGDTWEASSPTGMRKVSLAQTGAFFDDTANSIHTAWSGPTLVSRIVCLAWAGNVIGRIFAGLQGTLGTTYEAMAKLGSLTNANVTYVASGQYDEGVIVQEFATRTDDWWTAAEGNSVDNGASSANGGIGYIEIAGFSGPNPLTVKIRHAPDGGGTGATWADLITFTVTGAQTAQRIAVSGAVNRWLSVKATGFGNVSPSASISASISPSLSASSSASPSLSPSASISPSRSTSLSPSASISPSASTSLSPSSSRSPSVSASSSASPSRSPSASISPSSSVSPSAGAGPASSVTVFVGFSRS